jgi:2'-5' RNA ligase
VTSARVFIALWPDEATRRALRKTCRAVVAYCGGRPVPSAHYHLTLAFLGHVPVELLADIRAAAATAVRPVPALVLDRFGHFPRARVLWIGPTHPPDGLAALAADLWSALAPLGLRPDQRAFRPHLTIARKLHRPPADQRPTPVAWQPAGFALVRSVTAASGARYTVDQCFEEGSSTEP